MASGKATAIGTISEVSPVKTDVANIDSRVAKKVHRHGQLDFGHWGVISTKAGLGTYPSVTINTESGFAVVYAVARSDVELVVNVIANSDGILAQVPLPDGDKISYPFFKRAQGFFCATQGLMFRALRK